MKFKRSSGQHFVASITHRELCAGTLIVVCVGLAPGARIERASRAIEVGRR